VSIDSRTITARITESPMTNAFSILSMIVLSVRQVPRPVGL
jgi:hypothetical protein